MKMKDSYYQIVRGICIIAVVWIHCAGVQSIGINADSIYYVFQRNLINFPVAVFFALAGYFIPMKWGGTATITSQDFQEFLSLM